MSSDHNAPSRATASTVLSFLGKPRVRGYLDACGGDPDAALALYRWNTLAGGALWESLSHLEIVLRNVLADRLAARHTAAGRPESWLDDPAGELDARARRDIAAARRRARSKGKSATEGQTLAELPFGFWKFLMAKRYTFLWPDLVSGFPNAPDRARTTIEEPVSRLHQLRNRLAHHERVWNQPLKDRYRDLVFLLGCVNEDLVAWVAAGCRVETVLDTCPIERPHP